MRRIVCLGDSLTSGHGIGSAAAHPALLHQRVRRAGFPYEVVNAGVSRETSAQALARLDRALVGDVRVLIVALADVIWPYLEKILTEPSVLASPST
jgi:acyl-CoA thioesterase I